MSGSTNSLPTWGITINCADGDALEACVLWSSGGQVGRFLGVGHARLIRRDHILYVNKSIFFTLLLEEVECISNQLAKASAFLLTIVNAISQILVASVVEVQYWKYLHKEPNVAGYLSRTFLTS